MDALVYGILLPLAVGVALPLAVGVWWGCREVDRQRARDNQEAEEADN